MLVRPKDYLTELRFRMMFPYYESRGKVNMRLARIIDNLYSIAGFDKNLEIGNYTSLKLKIRGKSEIVITVDHVESNQLNISTRSEINGLYTEVVNLNQESKDYDYRDVLLLCLTMIL